MPGEPWPLKKKITVSSGPALANVLRTVVAIGLAFTLVFNDLINSVGFSIAINLVAVALYVIIFLYFLFKMLLNNNINEEEPENPIQ